MSFCISAMHTFQNDWHTSVLLFCTPHDCCIVPTQLQPHSRNTTGIRHPFFGAAALWVLGFFRTTRRTGREPIAAGHGRTEPLSRGNWRTTTTTTRRALGRSGNCMSVITNARALKRSTCFCFLATNTQCKKGQQSVTLRPPR